MKPILLWDPRFPQYQPQRYVFPDALASAAVRSGVAAAANPADAGVLAVGGPLSPADLTEVLIEQGNFRTMTRVILPLSVVMIGAALGLLTAIGNILGGNGAPQLGSLTLSPEPVTGVASSGVILGATAGSTITSGIAGLTVNSAARTFTFNGSAAAGTSANGLTETLATASNSPRLNAVTIALTGPDFVINSAADFANIPATLKANGGVIAVAPGNYGNLAIVGLRPSVPLKFVALNPATEMFGSSGQRRPTTGAKARIDQLSLQNCTNLRFEQLEIVSTADGLAVNNRCIFLDTLVNNIVFSANHVHGGYRGNPDVPFDPLAQYPEYGGFEAIMSGGKITGINIVNSYVGDQVSAPGTYPIGTTSSAGAGTGFAATCVVEYTTKPPRAGKPPITGYHVTSVTPGFSQGSGYGSRDSQGVLTDITTGTRYAVLYFDGGSGKKWLYGPYALQGTVAVGGDFTFVDNLVTDCHSGVRAEPSEAGTHTVDRNTFDRLYSDDISVNKGTSWSKLRIRGNFITRPFSCISDPGNPHTDGIQASLKNLALTVSDIIIDGNVIVTGLTRGGMQAVFPSDVSGAGRFKGVYIRNNIIAVDEETTAGIVVPNPEDVYMYRNFVGKYSDVDSGGTSYASRIFVAMSADSSENLSTAIWDNICETLLADRIAPDERRSNVRMGLRGQSVGGSYASVLAKGSAPVTKDEMIAFFTSKPAYAGKGINGDGYMNWATGEVDVSKEPTFFRFKSQALQAPGSTLLSNWSPVLGGNANQPISIVGGEYRIADDRAGTNATAWTTAAGTVAKGRYVQVRVVNGAAGTVTTTATLTIANDTAAFSGTTISTSSYPRVTFDSADRFQRAAASLGADSPLMTIGFKARFPDGFTNGSSNLTFFASSPATGSGRIVLLFLPTGLLRATFTNAAGYVCGTNMSSNGLVAGKGLFDGGVHEILLTVDVSQATAAAGITLVVDGNDRTVAGGWSGGPGVTLNHGSVTAAYSFGGVTTPLLAGFEVDYFALGIQGRVDITGSEGIAKFAPDLIGRNGSGLYGKPLEILLTGNAVQWNAGGGINAGYATPFVLINGTSVADTVANQAAW